ncbi:MAG: MarR family transcriptional regulator [Leptospiraceae bacterium]|nr:MarR family transcriptional regulator [Leptospiraceae bacterium]MCK6380931.1 MarR family transcriptional regulator [Leptospiraceae bacterium]NUM40013.1 MarR family transcriptional regulator [Leptospiraceae bacterium]
MGTHFKGSQTEIQALDCFIKLMRASESVNYRTGKYINKIGLSPSQFGVLESLFHLGPMCQNELGKKLLKSGGNITMVLNNLEKRGWIERKRETKDKRYISVHLSHSGKKFISEIFPRQVQIITEEMSKLSKAEQEDLSRICKKLGIENFEKNCG